MEWSLAEMEKELDADFLQAHNSVKNYVRVVGCPEWWANKLALKLINRCMERESIDAFCASIMIFYQFGLVAMNQRFTVLEDRRKQGRKSLWHKCKSYMSVHGRPRR